MTLDVGLARWAERDVAAPWRPDGLDEIEAALSTMRPQGEGFASPAFREWFAQHGAEYERLRELERQLDLLVKHVAGNTLTPEQGDEYAADLLERDIPIFGRPLAKTDEARELQRQWRETSTSLTRMVVLHPDKWKAGNEETRESAERLRRYDPETRRLLADLSLRTREAVTAGMAPAMAVAPRARERRRVASTSRRGPPSGDDSSGSDPPLVWLTGHAVEQAAVRAGLGAEAALAEVRAALAAGRASRTKPAFLGEPARSPNGRVYTWSPDRRRCYVLAENGNVTTILTPRPRRDFEPGQGATALAQAFERAGAA